MTSTAGGRTSRCYRIHWNDPLSPCVDRVDALSPLHALDIYSIKHGYGGYSENAVQQPLHEVLGVDEHGLWATYENGTLWALADDVREEVELERIIFAGVWVTVLRNGDGQLTVVINTEGAEEEDDHGNPYMQVLLNDAQLYDHERPKPPAESQIVVSDPLLEHIELWLEEQGMRLFLIPDEEGSPTMYRIGPK